VQRLAHDDQLPGHEPGDLGRCGAAAEEGDQPAPADLPGGFPGTVPADDEPAGVAVLGRSPAGLTILAGAAGGDLVPQRGVAVRVRVGAVERRVGGCPAPQPCAVPWAGCVRSGGEVGFPVAQAADQARAGGQVAGDPRRI